MSNKFAPTEKQRLDFSACIEKDIRVYPVAIPNSDKYYVEVDNNGKKNLSLDKLTKEPIEYTDFTMHDLIF